MKLIVPLLLILPLLTTATDKVEILRRLSRGAKGSTSDRKQLRERQAGGEDDEPSLHQRRLRKGSKKKSKYSDSDEDRTTEGAGFGKTSPVDSADFGEGADESCQFLEIAFYASDFNDPSMAFIDGDHEGNHGTFGGFGIPIYDSVTLTSIGTLKEFYNWVPENDCAFSGAWTFDGSNPKYGYGQMFYNGSCRGHQSGISGGTFDYACASGFDFMFTENQNTGIVYWHIYNCGECARSFS